MANVKPKKITGGRERGFAADGTPELADWHKNHMAQVAGIQII